MSVTFGTDGDKQKKAGHLCWDSLPLHAGQNKPAMVRRARGEYWTCWSQYSKRVQLGEQQQGPGEEPALSSNP